MTARTLTVLAAVAALAAPAFAQNVRLEFAARPRLVDCEGPCFRMDVTAVDAQGQPVAMDDRAVLTVSQNDQPVKVVSSQALRVASSAPASDAAAQTPSRRISLVLFDTSGSMNERLGNETKFTIARRQLEQLLGTFQEGIDRLAIVPFDSQRVAERIRAAAFEATKAGIRRQIAALQVRRSGNTALYSAVFEGLQVLKPYMQEDGQVSLVVFTDGKNDVRQPSDPGLLDGNDGLKTVTDFAQEVGTAIYTIGYGAPGVSFDESSLQALKYPAQSSNYFNAQSEARLTQIFSAISRRSGTGVRFLVYAAQTRREQLTGESVIFRVASGKLIAESPVWRGNPLMTPSYEGQLTAEERLAVVKNPRVPVENTSWMDFSPSVIRMLVLFAYSAVLAGLWFGVPRLIWPDRYIPKPALRPQAAARAPQRPAPGRPSSPTPRAPGAKADVTIANPRPGSGRPSPGAADRGREGAPPGRARESSPAPPTAPRPREPWAGREAGDATVFIPPSKKPGGSA